MLISAIPSPGFDTLQLGPLQLRLYGMMIATAVVVAVWVSQRRWADRGGDPDDIGAIATWAVPAGVIGARLYHVATDWQTYRSDWLSAFEIWNGGLGIPGGIAGGVAVGALVARRRGLSVAPLLDVVAPALLIAQAIGRLGNWFNQEVFGRPSDLPWALEISPVNRPEAYAGSVTFHPTFLYEGLWNIALMVILVALGRRQRLVEGQLFALYVTGYGIGRLWVEALRSDPASLLLGVRINLWVASIAIVAGIVVFVALGRSTRGQAAESASGSETSSSA